MNYLFIIIVIIILFLCSKREPYYNLFGQYIDGPSDELDGINEFSPYYRLSRSPYYWQRGLGIPMAGVVFMED